MQNKIITPLIGGRSAKAALFMQGGTTFNEDLFGAEHLMLEDENSVTDIASRRSLAASLKQFCVNDYLICHGKGKQIVNLSPWWRVSISLNDEPERLLVIPPLTDDFADKIILLHAARFPWPMPTNTGAQWAEMMRRLRVELPAYLAFLLKHTPPPKLQSDRFGVIAWQHPDLAESLADTAPERQLAGMIPLWMEGSERTRWEGTAAELRTALMEADCTKAEAKDVLKSRNQTGTYLSRLANQKHPGLTIQNRRTNHVRRWEIILTADFS